MAGHDYTFQKEPPGTAYSDPDKAGRKFYINHDKTIDESGRVVRGAVDDFFSSPIYMNGCPRQVTVSYREGAWNTWAVRK